MTVRLVVASSRGDVRRALSSALLGDRDLVVVGTARDPYEARDYLVHLQPDVLVLDPDCAWPGSCPGDGALLIEKLMRWQPVPVVVVTTSGRAALPAYRRLGVREFVVGEGDARALSGVGPALTAAVRRAASCAPPEPRRGPLVRPVVALGASTGGVAAIEAVLGALPLDGPAVLVVPLMPVDMVGAFAEKLAATCSIGVALARDGETVVPGKAYLAPGGRHMVLRRSPQGYVLALTDTPPVCRHRPSVDVLFESVAGTAGAESVGVLLTGIGQDGAHGLAAMRAAGAATIAQNQQTCAVYDMPRHAVECEAVDHLLPLRRIPVAALDLCRPRAREADQDGLAA